MKQDRCGELPQSNHLISIADQKDSCHLQLLFGSTQVDAVQLRVFHAAHHYLQHHLKHLKPAFRKRMHFQLYCPRYHIKNTSHNLNLRDHIMVKAQHLTLFFQEPAVMEMNYYLITPAIKGLPSSCHSVKYKAPATSSSHDESCLRSCRHRPDHKHMLLQQ